MNYIKLTDLENLVLKNDYKHAGLFNSSGQQILSPISIKTPIGEKLNIIRKRLDGQENGIYIIRFKHQIPKSAPVYDYYFNKGNVEASSTPIVVPLSSKNSNDEPVRGWNEALKDKQELAELKAKVTALENEKALLDAENKLLCEEAEVEEEAEEEPAAEAQMMDKAKSFMSEIMPMFMPVIDKHFELKTRQLDLEEKKLSQRGNRTPNLRSMHPFRPIPSPNDAENWNKYLEWLETISDDMFTLEMAHAETQRPDIWPHLAALYPLDNGGGNEEKTA